MQFDVFNSGHHMEGEHRTFNVPSQCKELDMCLIECYTQSS